MTFKFFKRLSIPALDKFGERVASVFSKKKKANNNQNAN
jgi:hypothetical protein